MLTTVSRLAVAARRPALARHISAGATTNSLRVAIVGSGPSGFYTAKYLLAAGSSKKKGFAGGASSVAPDGLPPPEVSEVTIVDRLPSPFGLVRYGVAPDHPEVKNVIDDFRSVAEDPR